MTEVLLTTQIAEAEPALVVQEMIKISIDFMTMDSKEIFRCFEIKISKSDFRSNHGHNFVGNFNYYVMPKELYYEVEKEIPKQKIAKKLKISKATLYRYLIYTDLFVPANCRRNTWAERGIYT